MSMILPLDCNACLCTLWVDCKQAVSLSQPLCIYFNKGSHMLSIADTWGCMQYFFKSCFVIVTTSFHSVRLTRMHQHPVPQKIKQSYTRAKMHCYTTSNRWGNFFQRGFLTNSSMTACLIATDDVYAHHQCQQSIFPSWNRCYTCLIIINNNETPKGLAMINSAAMPQQLTVKPSYASASTKALMVKHPYQAWLPCHLMI